MKPKLAPPAARPTLSRLPPLTALRTFVVAARQLNFARAAEELHVTAAAVGQQVRLLESHLGLPLFLREGKRLALAPAGQRLLPGLTDAFDSVVRAVAQVQEADANGPLTISVPPSFASKWLVPRLSSFNLLHPEIAVKVSASMTVIDFNAEPMDCALRYGAGDWPNLFVEKLIDESVFPVCSPALLRGEHPLDNPAALRFHTLLHDDWGANDPGCPDWRMWLRAAGLRDIEADRGLHFDQSSLVLEAAAASQGVALAKASLAEADLKAGRLVRPFGDAQKVAFAYYFVSPRQNLDFPRVGSFLAWLRDEAVGADE